MLFDGRYRTDVDRATCFEVCETLKEAKGNADDYGDDTVIVQCETFGSEIVKSKILT